MKSRLIVPALAAVVLCFSSCVKEYTCHCVYVANTLGPNAGQANKDEHNTVEGRTIEDARTECLGQEGKYITQFYSGTCTVD